MSHVLIKKVMFAHDSTKVIELKLNVKVILTHIYDVYVEIGIIFVNNKRAQILR